MSKRYVRIDLEYEFDGEALYLMSTELSKILPILFRHDELKIIYTRDTPILDDLNKFFYKRKEND